MDSADIERRAEATCAKPARATPCCLVRKPVNVWKVGT